MNGSAIRLYILAFCAFAMLAGPPGKAAASARTRSGVVNVYRWFNSRNGDHFYTTDPSGELAPRARYRYEGVGFRLWRSRVSGSTLLYRWYNPRNGDHFYTTDPSGELAPRSGYRREPALGWILRRRAPGTIPLHRWYNPRSGDHFYTTHPTGELAPRAGYRYEGVTGYVLPASGPVPARGRACGYRLGSAIYRKWIRLGGRRSFLGCPVMNEAEAGRSRRGTAGRFARFRGGYIIWHRTGRYAGRAFAIRGCNFRLYRRMRGTLSWLGFPVSDERSVRGGRRSDFEGGYLFWNARTNRCRAFRYGRTPPSPPLPVRGMGPLEYGINRRGSDYRNFFLSRANPNLCRSACAREGRCRSFTYVKPGYQGRRARCWLKYRVPRATRESCCVSGVKRRTAPPPPPRGGRRFLNPTIGGVAVDLCRWWGRGCGKPAADAFCRRKGYARSVGHRVWHDRPPTRIIETGQICRQSFCDRFSSITCAGRRTPPPPRRSSRIGWSRNATSLRGRIGRRFRFYCPPGGRLSSVWGTNIYTDDSSICTAAVHAGFIRRRYGGNVRIEIRRGRSSYRGSVRNGVRSRSWGAWRGSFVLLRSR